LTPAFLFCKSLPLLQPVNGSSEGAQPVERVFRESFEDGDSTFRPIIKGSAQAEFDLTSTAAASEGTLCNAQPVTSLYAVAIVTELPAVL
jgi:hypothetical protein